MTDIKIGIPDSYKARALWDSGAMPSILCQSMVPLGTIIQPTSVKLSGVSSKQIVVVGEANINLQIGNLVFRQTFIIVPKGAMKFPEQSTVILGANFISYYGFCIDAARWTIRQNDTHVTSILPAIIDACLYTSVRTVLKVESSVNNEPREVPRQIGTQQRSATEKLPQVRTGGVTNRPLQKKVTFDPSTSKAKHKRVVSTPEAETCPTFKKVNGSFKYAVLPCASYECPLGTTAIKVRLQHPDSVYTINSDDCNSYIIEPNLFLPGVVILQTAVSGKQLWALVNNCNKTTEIIRRDTPITSAYICQKDTEFVGMNMLKDDKYVPMNMQDNAARTMAIIATIQDVTAQADDGSSTQLDDLDRSLDFDPADVNSVPVIHNEDRLQKIIEIMKVDSWEISDPERQRAVNLIRKHQKAFHIKGDPLPLTPLLQHKIELIDDNQIVHTPPRWTPVRLRPFVEKEVKNLVKLDLAYRSLSPHTSPIVLVKKKGDKNSFRTCVDYRRLNLVTKPQFYPQRSIDEILFKIASAMIISIFDMPSAYMQIGLELLSQQYSAFTTHLGAYAFSRMSFGLKNAAYSLSMLMDMILGDLRSHTENYHDDIYVFSNDVQSHFGHIEESLLAIIKANIVISAEKSRLFRKQANILGHKVGQGFIRPDQEKTEAVMKMKPPKNRTGVRSFLGMTSFFRKFIKDYAKTAKPLTQLTSENVAWVWGKQQDEAFAALKTKLCEGPVLRAPDWNKPWYLITDASSGAIGSWLAQRHDSVLHPVAYHSRQLKSNELAWTLDAYEGETLAIYDSIRKFKPFLYGARLIILSDSRCLQWLFTKGQYKSPRLTRWALMIQGFGADILHLPGKLNQPADTLSRYPLHEVGSSDHQKGNDLGKGEANTPSLPSVNTLPHRKLIQVSDPVERNILARAELIVDGDPTDPGNITLISLTEFPGSLTGISEGVKIYNLRANIPDDTDADDPVIWSQTEIKAEQRNDVLLKFIIKYLEDPSPLHRSSVDPNIKDLHDYLVDNTGILFKQQVDPKAKDTRGPEEVLVVPFSLQKRAMAAVHNSNASGHPGPDRSCWSAHRRFFWRNMDRHIKNYAESCEICIKFKGRPHPPVSTRRYPIPDRPWQSVSIDLVGRLPATTNKNKFILVCVDFLTRYTVAVPLMTKTAKEVAQALGKIFCEHGVPQVVLSDNGTEFRNKMMTELASLLQFKHTTIACHHPASQGLVERKNQAVMIALRQLYDERPEDWDICLPYAILAVNSAYCKSTGDTPFFLYRHRDPDAPLHMRTTPNTSKNSPQQFVRDDVQRARVAYEIVKEKLLESADRQIRYKDKKSHDNKICVDDRVFIKYVKNKPGDNKLSPKFTGPFRIISQKSPSVFKLKNLSNGKESEAHVENMKVVKERFASLHDFPRARLPFQWQDPPALNEQLPIVPLDPTIQILEPTQAQTSRRVTRSANRQFP